jgi:hypothetical protein
VYNFHIAEFQCYAVGRNSVLVHNDNLDLPANQNPGAEPNPGGPGPEGEPQGEPAAPGEPGADDAARQQEIEDIKDEIAETEEKIESIRNDDYGYGKHDTSGSEQYLIELAKRLAQLQAGK